MKKLVIAMTLLAAAQAALAQPWSFTKIVDTDTMVPNSSENFNIDDAFQSVSVFGDRVAFRGRSHTGLQGVYEWRNGAGRAVADRTIALPRGGGTFRGVTTVAMTATGVTFQGGNGSSVSGYYAENGTTLSRVVDTLDIAPERGIAFDGWGTSHDASGDSVLFEGYADQGSFQGIYRNDGGVLSRVVDLTMSPPNRSDLFSRFKSWRLEGDATYFSADTSAGYLGVFKSQGGVLSTLIDESMSLPDGRRLISPGLARPDHGSLLFQAFADGDTQVLAKQVGNSIQLVVDSTDDPPGPSTSYRGINQFEYQNGVLVFSANDSTIYTNYGGVLQRVIGPDDVLDGKVVAGVFFYEHGFDGTNAAFRVIFRGDSTFHYDRAIYTVTIPAPGAAGLVFSCTMLALGRRRRAGFVAIRRRR